MTAAKDLQLCIVGLGYVGLPLAHAFAEKGFKVSGFDVSDKRISELKSGHDRTRELNEAELKDTSITLTTDPTMFNGRSSPRSSSPMMTSRATADVCRFMSPPVQRSASAGTGAT